MGSKTWMLVYSDGNAAESLKNKSEIDRVKTTKLVNELFTKEKLEQIDDVDLSNTCPPNNKIYAGYFSGVFIVAAKEFGIDCPSKLPIKFLKKDFGNTIQLHAMHSVVDWLAFAIWKNGKLVRSLSLSPDTEIIEDIGEKFEFEMPYWNGKHPALDPEEDEDSYPLPFHPLELGEVVLRDFFGYVLEGEVDDSLIEPEDITLLAFKRPPWWKFW